MAAGKKKKMKKNQTVREFGIEIIEWMKRGYRKKIESDGNSHRELDI